MKELLKQIKYFQNLPDDILQKIAEISLLMNVKKGDTIFTKLSKATGFYILKEGTLKIYTIEPLSGKEQVVKILKPVSMFGEAASLSGQHFPVNVEALENSQIIYIDREKLLELAKEHPEICFSIASVLAQRLYHLVNLLEILSIGSAVPRVAKYILRNQKDGVIEDFKTTLVAKFLNLTPEAVSRALSNLKNSGVIEKDKKKVIITNLQKLKQLAGDY
jgi:CRP/FNR family transcriptional regulator